MPLLLASKYTLPAMLTGRTSEKLLSGEPLTSVGSPPLSFRAIPTIWLVGVPPIMANATATFAALPGYAGSSWAYRRDIQAGDGPSLRALVFAAMLGGTLGALLLLITPEDLFSGVVPWLLLIATLAFAAGPALLRGLLASGRRLPDAVSLALLLLALAASDAAFAIVVNPMGLLDYIVPDNVR